MSSTGWLVAVIGALSFAALVQAPPPHNVSPTGSQWRLDFKPGYTGAEYDKGHFTNYQQCNEAGRYAADVQAAQLNAPVAAWHCQHIIIPETPS